MTKPWKITPDWAGQTVAVLGSGPSLTPAVIESLAQHRVIVVNYSFALAPEADMLVALDADPVFWASAAGFTGMRVCGTAIDEIDALCAGPRFERITLAPGHVIETCNSGLAAIRIAAEMGAARIILAGFDPETGGHFDGRPADAPGTPREYVGLAQGLAALIAELQGKGVAVEWFEPAAPAAPAEDAAPRKRQKAA